MDDARFDAFTRTLARSPSRRHVLAGLASALAVIVRAEPTAAAPRPGKGKNKPPKGACAAPGFCCNCYYDTGNTSCTTAVSSSEECALVCNNASGGQYGFNDPAVMSPGNAIVCGPENRCTVVQC